MNFFIAYQEKPDKGGAWVHDNKRIVWRYATGWMPLDVLTAMPVDVMLAAWEHANAGGMDTVRRAEAVEVFKVISAAYDTERLSA